MDSVKFSGDLIAGVSLLSTRILRLELDRQTNDNSSEESNRHISLKFVEIYLLPRSLYILRGPMRYDFSHAVLGVKHTPKHVAQLDSVSRRVSIMFRNVHPDDDTEVKDRFH